MPNGTAGILGPCSCHWVLKAFSIGFKQNERTYYLLRKQPLLWCNNPCNIKLITWLSPNRKAVCGKLLSWKKIFFIVKRNIYYHEKNYLLSWKEFFFFMKIIRRRWLFILLEFTFMVFKVYLCANERASFSKQ